MISTALLVRWMGGWHDVTDPGITARWGRKEAMLSLGAVEALSEVETVSREQLTIFGDPLTEIACDSFPVGEPDTPYIAYRPGDHVTVPNAAGREPTNERVQAVTVAMDDNGRVTYATELRNPLLDGRERFAENLAKLANGSIGGYSKVAQPSTMAASTQARANLATAEVPTTPWLVTANQPAPMVVGYSEKLTQGPTGQGMHTITRATMVLHGPFTGYVGGVNLASDVPSDPTDLKRIAVRQLGSYMVPETEYPMYFYNDTDEPPYDLMLGAGENLYVYAQGTSGAIVPPLTVTIEFANLSGPTTLAWFAGRPPWWS